MSAIGKERVTLKGKEPFIAIITIIIAVIVTMLSIITPSKSESATETIVAPSTVPTETISTSKTGTVTGWIPYWTASETIMGTIKKSNNRMDTVSPFWYHLTEPDSSTSNVPEVTQHSLASGTTETWTEYYHTNNLKVIPTITDGTTENYLANVLNSPTATEELANRIVTFIETSNYQGVDLDFEGFAYRDNRETWETTRTQWVKFIEILANKIHQKKLLLYVTVPPTYDSDQDNSSGYWVYDIKELGKHADMVRIMAYDYSWNTPGPIGPLPWMKRLIDYTVTQVPAKKVQLGVPAYGRDWVSNTVGSCPDTVNLKRISYTSVEAQQLAKQLNIKPVWNSTFGEKTFSYSRTHIGTQTFKPASNGKPRTLPAECTVTRTVWYPDSRSIKTRYRYAMEKGLNGIAIWTVPNVPGKTWKQLTVPI